MWVRFPLAWLVYISQQSQFATMKKYNKYAAHHVQKINYLKKKLPVEYSLTFKSLIPPRSNVNIQELTISLFDENNELPKRLLIKNSYILLSWLFFLIKINRKLTKDDNFSKIIPRLSIKPYRNSKFTIIKAPMAHKTFSQEQYLYSYYSMSTKFIFFLKNINLDINKALFFLVILKQSRFSFETNLFFLQKLTINTLITDTKYLSFFNFNTK